VADKACMHDPVDTGAGAELMNDVDRTLRLLPSLSGPAGWLFAAAAFGVALAARFVLDHSLPPGFPFLTFFPAVVLTALFVGLWPAVAVSVLSFFSAWWWFVPPANSFALTGGKAVALVFFAVIAAVDVAVIEAMRRALDNLERERARSEKLAERNATLFREMQHRVSNNLQTAASLLSAQRCGLTDPAARQALGEAVERLALIGRVHRLAHDPHARGIAAAAMLAELCDDVAATAGAPHGTCGVEADPTILLNPDQMVPVALVLAELVANALEHGLHGQHGRIAARMVRGSAGAAVLEVRDDGRGLPESFDLAASRTLGLTLAKALTRQLEGTLEIGPAPGGGTLARLSFPLAAPVTEP